MPAPILRVRNLAKTYANTPAVAGISFELCPGEIIGLLGPNGAGKTTAISMILGLLKPSGGTIEIFDQDLKKYRSKISQEINFSAVYSHLPANLTVRQNLQVFGLLYEVKNLKIKIQTLLAEFDLTQFEHTKTGLLSSGELSRLNLAKAVINDPRLILLDEPTASLDPSVAELIRERIQAYVSKNQAAVLWASHNMKEIETVCDAVHFLSRGRILLSGNPRTLAAEHGKKDLEALFIAVAREPLSFVNSVN